MFKVLSYYKIVDNIKRDILILFLINEKIIYMKVNEVAYITGVKIWQLNFLILVF